jgi:hypothetical protein
MFRAVFLPIIRSLIIKLELSASVGFIHKESITMHGHTTPPPKKKQVCVLGGKGTAKDEQRIGNSDKCDHKSRTYVVSARILLSLMVFLPQKNSLSIWFDKKFCSSGV